MLSGPDLCVHLPLAILPAQLASFRQKRAKSDCAGTTKKTQKRQGQTVEKDDNSTQDRHVEPAPPSASATELNKTNHEVHRSLNKLSLWLSGFFLYNQLFWLRTCFFTWHSFFFSDHNTCLTYFFCPLFLTLCFLTCSWPLPDKHTLENWVTNHYIALRACCHGNLARINWSPFLLLLFFCIYLIAFTCCTKCTSVALGVCWYFVLK